MAFAAAVLVVAAAAIYLGFAAINEFARRQIEWPWPAKARLRAAWVVLVGGIGLGALLIHTPRTDSWPNSQDRQEHQTNLEAEPGTPPKRDLPVGDAILMPTMFGVIALIAGALLIVAGTSKENKVAQYAGTACVIGALLSHASLIRDLKIGDILKVEHLDPKLTISSGGSPLPGAERLVSLTGFNPAARSIAGMDDRISTGVCDKLRTHRTDGEEAIVLIIGGTDRVRLSEKSQETYESNFSLATARANEAAKRVAHCDPAPVRILTWGAGPQEFLERPVVRGKDPGDPDDRRVEIWAVWQPAAMDKRQPEKPSQSKSQFGGLTLFGIVALAAMVFFYSFERPIFILLFAIACACASIYAFLSGIWPFGVGEAIWQITGAQALVGPHARPRREQSACQPWRHRWQRFRLRRLMPPREPSPTPSFESWLALSTSFVILTVSFAFGLFCWPAVYRPLTRAFHWSFASANAGGAIALLMIGLLSPFVGSLVDRFKPKPVILGGTLLVAAALALLSTIQSLPQYYSYCALLGIGASAVSILPTSILIGPAFSQWRGLAVGVINAGIGLGGYIAPRLATAQIAKRGIPGMFLVLAACMAIPFVATLALVRNREAARPATSSPRSPSARELARMPMFWIYGAGLFFTAHAMLGVQQNLISYLTGEHISAVAAASILGIALAAAAPGKLISGWLGDKASARAGMIFSVVCVALGILALLNTAPQSRTMMYALAVVFGMGYGGIFNATPTIVFEHFGTHRVGNAMGLFYVFFGLGTASGGELAGYIFDETHRWAAAFTVDLALACAALLLVLVSGRVTSRASVAADAATAKTALTTS